MQFDHTGAERGPDPTPFCVELEHLRANPNSLERAVGALRGLYGLKIVRSGRKIRCIEVQREAAREFVGGVWLEAVVFGLVCDVFRKIPKTAKPEIVAGAKLAVESPPPRSSNVPPLDNELDVAITIDDQLHVIEVKAVTNSKGFGEYITKLVTLRQELGSQVMRTFLVAPLLRDLA